MAGDLRTSSVDNNWPQADILQHCDIFDHCFLQLGVYHRRTTVLYHGDRSGKAANIRNCFNKGFGLQDLLGHRLGSQLR